MEYLGVIIVAVTIMFFALRSQYNGLLDCNWCNSKDDYINILTSCSQHGWCSKSSDQEHIIMIIVVLLIFTFLGVVNSIGFMPVVVILILAIEFFILKRYYAKKATKEIRKMEQQK